MNTANSTVQQLWLQHGVIFNHDHLTLGCTGESDLKSRSGLIQKCIFVLSLNTFKLNKRGVGEEAR